MKTCQVRNYVNIARIQLWRNAQSSQSAHDKLFFCEIFPIASLVKFYRIHHTLCVCTFSIIWENLLDQVIAFKPSCRIYFFPRVFFWLFSIFLSFMVGWGFGFWAWVLFLGLGFSVFGVWGLWSGALWDFRGWSFLYKHRRITWVKTVCHAEEWCQ